MDAPKQERNQQDGPEAGAVLLATRPAEEIAKLSGHGVCIRFRLAPEAWADVPEALLTQAQRRADAVEIRGVDDLLGHFEAWKNIGPAKAK